MLDPDKAATGDHDLDREGLPPQDGDNAYLDGPY